MDKPLIQLLEDLESRPTGVSKPSDDIPTAQARLRAEFPAAIDSHCPHKIKPGTWRVVPIEPACRVRAKPA